jgi:hypothetical protein
MPINPSVCKPEGASRKGQAGGKAPSGLPHSDLLLFGLPLPGRFPHVLASVIGVSCIFTTATMGHPAVIYHLLYSILHEQWDTILSIRTKLSFVGNGIRPVRCRAVCRVPRSPAPSTGHVGYRTRASFWPHVPRRAALPGPALQR